MLTARFVLTLASSSGTHCSSLGALRSALKIRAVSLRSVGQGLSTKRLAVGVQLRSPRVIKARSVQTAAQLADAWNDSSATMSSDELSALYKNLKASGIFLKVSADSKSGLLIGNAGSFGAVPARVLEDNTTTGLDELAASLGATGATLMTIAAVPEPASPALFLAGVGLAGLGAGILAGDGLWNLIEGDPPAATSKPTSSNDSSSDTGSDGEDSSVPDGSVWGSVDGDEQRLADGIVSLDLTGTPNDYSAGQGLNIPGLGGDGSGGTDDGGVSPDPGDGSDGWGIG